MEKLIVFIKNPVEGKVKTRLAATIGNERALKVYRQLLSHTLTITTNLSIFRSVHYSNFIPAEDEWKQHGFNQELQTGNDLGAKMHNAFASAFETGYSKVVLIGSDCAELDAVILKQAFEGLDTHEVLIGPAKDGGYYLIAMSKLYPELFTRKRWSTDTVLSDTIEDLNEKQRRYLLLPELSDVDIEQDLITLKNDFHYNSNV